MFLIRSGLIFRHSLTIYANKNHGCKLKKKSFYLGESLRVCYIILIFKWRIIHDGAHEMAYLFVVSVWTRQNCDYSAVAFSSVSLTQNSPDFLIYEGHESQFARFVDSCQCPHWQLLPT